MSSCLFFYEDIAFFCLIRLLSSIMYHLCLGPYINSFMRQIEILWPLQKYGEALHSERWLCNTSSQFLK